MGPDLIARGLGSTSCSHIYLRSGLTVPYHKALPISTVGIAATHRARANLQPANLSCEASCFGIMCAETEDSAKCLHTLMNPARETPTPSQYEALFHQGLLPPFGRESGFYEHPLGLPQLTHL